MAVAPRFHDRMRPSKSVKITLSGTASSSAA
jgi:hypothetical protein